MIKSLFLKRLITSSFSARSYFSLSNVYLNGPWHLEISENVLHCITHWPRVYCTSTTKLAFENLLLYSRHRVQWFDAVTCALCFLAGPMCSIMVRFPNGSRTHLSLSAEASLKVSTVWASGGAISRALSKTFTKHRETRTEHLSSSEGLKTFFDTKYVAFSFFFSDGSESLQMLGNKSSDFFRL